MQQDLKLLLTNFTTHLQKLGEIDHRLGIAYSKAVNLLLQNTNIKAQEVVAIGCHGQTVFHAPREQYPFTMQIGDPNLIVANTKITTVSDFRRLDMAYGGNGAPLTPAFNQYFYTQPTNNGQF